MLLRIGRICRHDWSDVIDPRKPHLTPDETNTYVKAESLADPYRMRCVHLLSSCRSKLFMVVQTNLGSDHNSSNNEELGQQASVGDRLPTSPKALSGVAPFPSHSILWRKTRNTGRIIASDGRAKTSSVCIHSWRPSGESCSARIVRPSLTVS